jgi:hypothetical protein
VGGIVAFAIFHGLPHLCVKSKTPSKKNTNTTASYDELKGKRAWDVALAPVKSLPVQAFMLYMSGGGVQIFSIGIVFMLLLSPIKNIAGMNEGVFFQFSLRILHQGILFPNSIRTIRTVKQKSQLYHDIASS